MFTFPSPGGASQADCWPCTAGQYCEKPGLSYPTGPCNAGYYCPGNDTISVPDPNHRLCPPGHMCPVGSSQPLGCPAGTSQPDAGKDTCIACPAGYYCKSSTIPDPVACGPYHYCPAGKWTLCRIIGLNIFYWLIRKEDKALCELFSAV